MRGTWKRVPWRGIVGISLIVGALGLLGYRWRVDRLSCHLCRGLKNLQTTSVFGLEMEHQERILTSGRPGPGHRHDWWRYSYSYRNGPWGILGMGVACHTESRYRDGWRPPRPDSKNGRD